MVASWFRLRLPKTKRPLFPLLKVIRTDWACWDPARLPPSFWKWTSTDYLEFYAKWCSKPPSCWCGNGFFAKKEFICWRGERTLRTNTQLKICGTWWWEKWMRVRDSLKPLISRLKLSWNARATFRKIRCREDESLSSKMKVQVRQSMSSVAV